jgi:hypothetical protein
MRGDFLWQNAGRQKPRLENLVSLKPLILNSPFLSSFRFFICVALVKIVFWSGVSFSVILYADSQGGVLVPYGGTGAINAGENFILIVGKINHLFLKR